MACTHRSSRSLLTSLAEGQLHLIERALLRGEGDVLLADRSRLLRDALDAQLADVIRYIGPVLYLLAAGCTRAALVVGEDHRAVGRPHAHQRRAFRDVVGHCVIPLTS